MSRKALSVHSGQIVVAEVVGAVLVLAAVSGAAGWSVGIPVAVALATVGFGRWRRRWLYRWLGVALHYASRPKLLPPTTGPIDLLALIDPVARVVGADLGGRGYGLIEDEYGVTAVLELGDPTSLLADTPLMLPSPVPLLPATSEGPGVQVQLLVSGAPAPALSRAAGIPATSYRQLTEGRIAAAQRAFLAVRVRRDDSGWLDDDLRRTLAGTLRRVRRRLTQDGVPHRPLGRDATLIALAELAHLCTGSPVRESWGGLRVGGVRQTTVRVRRFALLRPELAAQVIPRLLTLPAIGTTISVAAAPSGVDIVVRVAAPDATRLASTVHTLHRLLVSAGLEGIRLDGEHLLGLAATLPLGRIGEPSPAGAPAAYGTELPGAGVMLGRNRKGQPVTVRLVRPEPTRALLVGGVRAAELITLRALALGVHVLIQTGRPYAWEPFLRAVSLPSDAVALVPAGRPVALPEGGPLAPQLVVVDVGPVLGDLPVGDAGWRTTLVLRDDLAPADLDTLARADLVILQPLSAAEAALAGATLGLPGEGQEWLARIRADMIGVVNRRAVRFALLSSTPLEQQLIGSPERVALV